MATLKVGQTHPLSFPVGTLALTLPHWWWVLLEGPDHGFLFYFCSELNEHILASLRASSSGY